VFWIEKSEHITVWVEVQITKSQPLKTVWQTCASSGSTSCYESSSIASRQTSRQFYNYSPTHTNTILTTRDVKWSSNFQTSNHIFEFGIATFDSHFRLALTQGVECHEHVISVSDWGATSQPSTALTCRWTEWLATHVRHLPHPGHCN